MKFLGDPQDTLKVIHIAGTSGKTSTAYYAAALLGQAGAKVGLTVSPHVDEINERVQINMVPLPEAEFCALLGDFLDRVERSGIDPSYFELMVAFAYDTFVKQGVDYAVVEVGLGGLLDGTNVVTRADKVSVITDIGLDHVEILGETLGEIAAQKAGIIQPHNQVFMYRQAEEVMRPVEARAAEQHATLQVVAPDTVSALGLVLLPPFQRRNFGLAERAAEYALGRDKHPPLTQQQLQTAAQTYIPARMEVVMVAGKTVIIDGSHNSQKITQLLAGIRERFPGRPIAALTAFVNGRDSRWQEALDVLLPEVSVLIATSFATAQDVPKVSVDPARIADYCVTAGLRDCTVYPDAPAAFRQLLGLPADVLLVVGSFYLLNHIRPLVAALGETT